MTTYEKIKKLCEDEGFAISSLPEKIPELSINKASITGKTDPNLALQKSR